MEEAPKRYMGHFAQRSKQAVPPRQSQGRRAGEKRLSLANPCGGASPFAAKTGQKSKKIIPQLGDYFF